MLETAPIAIPITHAPKVAPGRRDSWFMATPLAIAAVAVGVAIQLGGGTYTPEAMLLVTLAFACCFLAITMPSLRWVERAADSPAIFVLGAGLAVQLALAFGSPVVVYAAADTKIYELHRESLALAAILAGAGLSRKPWLGRARMPLLLALFVHLGITVVKSSPNPHIDVYAWHLEAFRALATFHDPYALTMPNIYGFTGWYAPGLATPASVFVGFPYPPLSLFFAWLGHLAGDYRYAMVAAMTLAAGFMAYAGPGRLGPTIAAVFLFTPRSLFVLEQGWTEPLVVLTLAATVFCARRLPRALAPAFGLLLASKQYAVFLLPLASLFRPRFPTRREHLLFVVQAVLLAAIFTVPMALWSLRPFVNSVIVFQGKQPFRGDALSYLVWSARDGVPRLPLWLNFAAALVALGIALWRAPRTAAGFAASASFVFLAFFSFAKQAFCNYYFMILGSICCALAALLPSTPRMDT